MFDIKTAVNSLGLVLTFIGTLLVYLNSPLNEHSINGGSASTNFDEVQADAKRKNILMRYGVFAVLFGTLLQLCSNYWPSAAQS